MNVTTPLLAKKKRKSVALNLDHRLPNSAIGNLHFAFGFHSLPSLPEGKCSSISQALRQQRVVIVNHDPFPQKTEKGSASPLPTPSSSFRSPLSALLPRLSSFDVRLPTL